MDDDERRLWKQPYYHGVLPREDVEEMVTKDGDFLVRRSDDGRDRLFVLSVNVSGLVNHVIFRQNREMITVDGNHERGFRSIERFIEVHLQNGKSISGDTFVPLKQGIQRRSWELAHSVITQGDELDRGASGTVRCGTFNDRHRQQTLQVALKELSHPNTKEQVKMTMHEARMMRNFDHHNVVKFYGVTVDRWPLFLVMEMATDGNLTHYLKKKTRSPRSKLFMSLGAAAGLDHIHSRGIIHCSVGARNCLYSQDMVKIADFGLAHKGTSKSTSGTQVPIKWLAPETIRGGFFTQKSDSWAFGVLCWEIFNNGEVPYQGLASSVVKEMILNGETPEFPEFIPDLFEEYILEHIWNADHNNRHTMGAVFDWLDRNMRQMTRGR